jgi:hypothetical protein
MKMLSIDPGEKSAWIALFTAMSGRIVPAVFKEMMSGKRKSSAEPTELDDFEAACRVLGFRSYPGRSGDLHGE